MSFRTQQVVYIKYVQFLYVNYTHCFLTLTFFILLCYLSYLWGFLGLQDWFRAWDSWKPYVYFLLFVCRSISKILHVGASWGKVTSSIRGNLKLRKRERKVTKRENAVKKIKTRFSTKTWESTMSRSVKTNFPCSAWVDQSSSKSLRFRSWY